MKSRTCSCFVDNRFYGGYDIKFGICVPEHILKERHEGEVRGWNELLFLPVYAVSSDSHRLCHCCGGSPVRAKRQQLQALRSEFETLRMKSGESVTDYFSRTMAIVNKMWIHGDKTEDVTIVEKILRSMTLKFNFVVCFIEEANDIEELSIDELQSSLLVHEQKINQQEKEEQALKASTENHSTPRGDRGRARGRGRGRGSNDRGNQQQHHHQHQENQFQGRG
ncbi:hypothetical protein F0562_017470 [Nyssa sinensis]|uniref:Uncharacterized protein n=1 Tax=Nyssa sinensis TaxID=561372 RepID=A0A5J4ZIT8_9ASTE|nr:hypothetical protein F0562_017470 [Nyssa sinensis]